MGGGGKSVSVPPWLGRRSGSPAPCGLAPAGKEGRAWPASPRRPRTVCRGPLIRAGAERVQPGQTSGGTSQLCER